MALAISSAVAVNDTTTSYGITVTGKLLSGALVTFEAYVGTALVSTCTTYSTSSTFYSITATEIYDGILNKSPTNGVTFKAYEWNVGETAITQSATKSGNVTINDRLDTFAYGSTAQPFDLDNVTHIITSWNRPHAGFHGKLAVYVNGTFCFSRYGFDTTTNFDPVDYAGYVDNMINAMGGVSPRVFLMVLTSQFQFTSLTDLSGGTLSSTGRTAIKTFVLKSDLLTFVSWTIGNNISYSVDVNSSGVTHTLELKFGTTSILTRTGLSGSETVITVTGGENTAMYNATPTVTSITATLILSTYDGATLVGTSQLTATASVDASIKPDFTTVTHSEETASPDIATIVGAYVQGLSTLDLDITGAVAGTGSTIKSYKITFESNVINAVGGITSAIVGSGTIAIVGRVTDYRDRYLEKTVNVSVLAYALPKVNRFVLKRTDSGGTEDPLGAYIEFDVDFSVSSLINGTEKNTLRYLLDTKQLPSGSWTNKATVDHSAVTYVNTSIVYSGYDILYAYSGRVQVVDKFFTVTATLSIATGVVIMSWDKVGVGIGKIRANGALDVGVDGIYNDGAYKGAGRFLNVFSSVNTYTDVTHYYNSSATATGEYLIDFGTGNYQIDAEITLADMGTGFAQILFKGYTYTAGASWYLPSVIVNGMTAVALPVRLGKHTTNGNRVMIIGGLSHVRAYPQIVINRIAMGYGATTTLAPTITLITDESDYTMLADTSIRATATTYGTSGTTHWVKYSDGTLLKYGTVSVTTAISTLWVAPIYQSGALVITFDTTVPFTTQPVVSLSHYNAGANTAWYSINGISTTAVTYQLTRAATLASTTYTVSFSAVGRW